MNNTRKRVLEIAAVALVLATAGANAVDAAGATLTPTKQLTANEANKTSGMTLANLKNGSYQIPNGACGTTVVKLRNGKGTVQGIDVVFNRAVFGKLTNHRENGAVCHISYKDEMFGWMQQVLFVVERDGKILQVAELGLDERDKLTNIEVRDGEARIEATSPDIGSGKLYQRCIQAKLVEGKDGCEMTAHEFNWLTTAKDHQESSRLASLR